MSHLRSVEHRAEVSPVSPGSTLVMKFGGSSLATASRLRAVAAVVRSSLDGLDSSQAPAKPRLLVVLSACAGVTDALVSCGQQLRDGRYRAAAVALDAVLAWHRSLAEELELGCGRHKQAMRERLDAMSTRLRRLVRGASLLGDWPAASQDLLLAHGELLSTTIFAALLPAAWVDARRLVRLHAGRHQIAGQSQVQADIDASKAQVERYLEPLWSRQGLVVTQGFIAGDASGQTLTLGRGGSDYSASLFGALLCAREVQIWTDVDGVLSADPRIVPQAKPVLRLAYEEAAELAAFGAKVLHPATILPAIDAAVPLSVRNSLRPDGPPTVISAHSPSGRPVSAIACRMPIQVLTVHTPRMLGGTGFLAKIFGCFAKHGISVDVVATSEVSVSATVEAGIDCHALLVDLNAIGQARLDSDRALISLVGECLPATPGVAGLAFTALRGINIDMISLGANKINLSFVLAAGGAAQAQRLLHAAFFEARCDEADHDCQTAAKARCSTAAMGPTCRSAEVVQC